MKYMHIPNAKHGLGFHVMAKQIAQMCNHNSFHCFYLYKETLLSTKNHWRMSCTILEKFIKQSIQKQNHEEIIFSWHEIKPGLNCPCCALKQYFAHIEPYVQKLAVQAQGARQYKGEG